MCPFSVGVLYVVFVSNLSFTFGCLQKLNVNGQIKSKPNYFYRDIIIDRLEAKVFLKIPCIDCTAYPALLTARYRLALYWLSCVLLQRKIDSVKAKTTGKLY